MNGINKFIECLKVIKHRILFDPRKIDHVSDRVDTIYELLKIVNPIGEIPFAFGLQRMSQRANSILLREVARILECHGVSYWLDFGTLLGAVRHGGSIPWDDDIDISVMRSDYDGLVDLLRKELKGNNEFIVNKSDCIRVRVAETACQIDIFPFDEYAMSPTDARLFEKAYWKCCNSVKRDWNRLFTDGNVVVNVTSKEIGRMIGGLKSSFDGSVRVVLPGVECGFRHYLVRNKDWIFPVKKIPYEEREFFAPRDPEMVLLQYYGDFMTYPETIHPHADIRARRTAKSYALLSKILKEGEL